MTIQEKVSYIDSHARNKELEKLMGDMTASQNEANSSRQETNLQIRGLEETIRAMKVKIDHLSSQGQDRSSLFHPNMPEILKNMKTKSFRQECVGPVGMFVKLKEGCKEFGQAVEMAIGCNSLTFIVTCEEDQTTMSEIIRSVGAGNRVNFVLVFVIIIMFLRIFLCC